jgi:hypothetical protein
MLHDVFPRPIPHEFRLEFLGSDDLENMLSHRLPAFPQALRNLSVAVWIMAPIEKPAIYIPREPIGPVIRVLYRHRPTAPSVDPQPREHVGTLHVVCVRGLFKRLVLTNH